MTTLQKGPRTSVSMPFLSHGFRKMVMASRGPKAILSLEAIFSTR